MVNSSSDCNKYFPSEKKKHDNVPILFTSENAKRLGVAETKKLLLTVPEI